MYTVRKVFNPGKGYSCVWRNWRANSHCNQLHGYDLIFEINFESDILSHEGWVIDFGGMDDIKKLIERQFDHTLLLALDDPDYNIIMDLHNRGIANVKPMPAVGCEAFAHWLFNAVEAWLAQSKRSISVTSVNVYEHGANSAGYR